jgi:hypothetical protein
LERRGVLLVVDLVRELLHGLLDAIVLSRLPELVETELLVDCIDCCSFRG